MKKGNFLLHLGYRGQGDILGRVHSQCQRTDLGLLNSCGLCFSEALWPVQALAHSLRKNTHEHFMSLLEIQEHTPRNTEILF